MFNIAVNYIRGIHRIGRVCTLDNKARAFANNKASEITYKLRYINVYIYTDRKACGQQTKKNPGSNKGSAGAEFGANREPARPIDLHHSRSLLINLHFSSHKLSFAR